MAKLYSTGPVLIYTNVLGAGAAFFGTGQQAPDINDRPEWDHVMNDLAGTKVPFDRMYEGEECMTSVMINRYNEAHLEAMMARPRPVFSVAGSNNSGERGTLMNQEGCSYTVWLVFPYTSKAYQVADAVPGYRFPYSFLLGPEGIKPGTKDKMVNLNWMHQNGWLPQNVTSSGTAGGTASASGVGSFLCYDHAVAGLPNIN